MAEAFNRRPPGPYLLLMHNAIDAAQSSTDGGSFQGSSGVLTETKRDIVDMVSLHRRTRPQKIKFRKECTLNTCMVWS